MKFSVKLIIAVVVFGGLVAVIWTAKHPYEVYRNQPIPSLSLVSLEGEHFSTDAWKQGKPFVINVFASWCGPCREEMPELVALSKHIPVYGIAVQDHPDAIAKMLEERGNPFTAVGMDNSNELAIKLQTTALPTTLVMDSHGQISTVQEGGIDPGEAKKKFIPPVKHLF